MLLLKFLHIAAPEGRTTREPDYFPNRHVPAGEVLSKIEILADPGFAAVLALTWIKKVLPTPSRRTVHASGGAECGTEF